MAGRGEPEMSKSNNRFVAWFQNYWYYYKTPVIIVGIFLVVAVIFIVDIMTPDTADMRFILVYNTETVTEEEFAEVADRAGQYIYDIDGNGKEQISPQMMQLKEDPKDDYDIMVYQQVTTTLVDDDVSFYVVDDYVYNYFLKSEALAPLSDFGITGGENEYRILLNDTDLLKGTELASKGKFYLVFKPKSESKKNSEDIEKRYEMAVAMAKSLLGQE